MIYSVQHFFGLCNKCEKFFGDSADDLQFDDEDDLIELMIENGWIIENIEEVYCPDCKKEIKE